ncbi:glucose-6-phosphate exchanger SLC37A4-like isoform X2 [Ostrea edulis]|uniref:glucose-6-phosphate exchanger SLC37A4-like isoform X2 n=1 Tax=Ostrea edulis TaxID=37623 RepID=UPI0024AF6CCD|nr:glucose-6-phosphate exchanger SLC37A4-like isoform X2 [Ostrea edulis]
MGRLSGPQLVTFTSVYVAYTLYVYVRRSFSYTIPILASEGTLDKKQLGVIVSSQSLAYTISKFCCGILGDIVSPRLLLSAGLVCSGITAIIFTGFDSVLLLSLWWFLNGLTHGAGWPSIAIILKAWTNPDQFGTVWSVVSTSMNLAGTVGPIVTTLLVTKLGWRYCIQIAGVLSITVGFLCLLIVKDKPGTNANKLKDMDNKKKEDKPAESNVSRSGFLSSVDIGGFVGSFVAGYLSDYMVSKNSSVSRPVIRKTLVLYFEILLGCVLYIFTIHISESSSNVIVTLVGFLIGVGIYGSISLFGVIAMETAPDKIAGTAHAISSIFSNMGLMLAGFPLSFISSLLDWQTTFLILVSTVTIVVTYLLLKLRTELSTFKSTSGKTLNLYNVLFSR